MNTGAPTYRYNIFHQHKFFNIKSAIMFYHWTKEAYNDKVFRSWNCNIGKREP